MVRKILFDWHPLEPEMVLQMAAQQVPCCISGGTIVPILAPYPGMNEAKRPKFLERYESMRLEGRHELSLEYHAEDERQGRAHELHREGPQEQWLEAENLKTCTRDYRCQGEKLIAVTMFWRMNDLYFGLWLAIHTPFAKLDDFMVAEATDKVPDGMQATWRLALHHRPDALERRKQRSGPRWNWRRSTATQIDTVIAKVVAETHLIDLHLADKVSSVLAGTRVVSRDDHTRTSQAAVGATKLHPLTTAAVENPHQEAP